MTARIFFFRTRQLLIGAERWEPTGSASLLHKQCNVYSSTAWITPRRAHMRNFIRALTRVRRLQERTPSLGSLLFGWCPRRDSKGFRLAKARARAHALATLRYKQATGLFALRSARSREFGAYKKGPHRWGPCCSDGARGETRTRTMSPPVDFESTASANSATRAHAMVR